ncbi:16937_t:CDS:1, partial [Acaulospora colombiana]
EGHRDHERLRLLSYTNADIFLVCYSVDNPDSLKDVKERWFPEINRHCPGIPFLIVGTKIDLRNDSIIVEKLLRQNKSPITVEQGEMLAQELKAVKYVECSALSLKGIDTVFYEAVCAVLGQ